jgi:hypothetical protein
MIKPFEKSRSGWNDNIKYYLEEVRHEGTDWNYLIRERARWLVSLNTTMRIRLP